MEQQEIEDANNDVPVNPEFKRRKETGLVPTAVESASAEAEDGNEASAENISNSSEFAGYCYEGKSFGQIAAETNLAVARAWRKRKQAGETQEASVAGEFKAANKNETGAAGSSEASTSEAAIEASVEI